MIEPISGSDIKITFDNLPYAVEILATHLERIEKLLLTNCDKHSLVDNELTIPEAAKILHLKTRSSVYKLINSGELLSFLYSGRRFVLASEILRYKKEQQKPTTK
ncbi:hypothetical protein CJD36_011070 [Flavipsychrobacter stenotrophus]|uniref:Helix-turn-helix domain-containing protein n=1 Tax=Flavipsychrobacter stenotrophus TaxID=2077091 RepID=A0A2S7SUB7_9BACT|nr:helix-turn-helix domain-containing protein [Flavipsychrobacter stenotrophus]PQJ10510.1 hypothetical protein CJD36_011070 [Flavipsychrobacter stenotrophus]